MQVPKTQFRRKEVKMVCGFVHMESTHRVCASLKVDNMYTGACVSEIVNVFHMLCVYCRQAAYGFLSVHLE